MNKDARPRIIACLALAVCLLLPVSSYAQQYIAPDYPPAADIKEWLLATEHQRLIPPGTTITPANWQQFKDEMSYGLQTLYSGRYFWRIPADSALIVGSTQILPLPKPYIEAGEKYSSETAIGVTSDGHRYIKNYEGGIPFPDAFLSRNDPQKGYKILADDYLSWVPDLYAQPFEHPGISCTQDRLGNINCTALVWIYTQVGWNTDPGVPRDYPQAGDAWFTQWFTVETAGRWKYTTNLTVFHKNPEHEPDDFVFVPALRRSLRLSVSARCARRRAAIWCWMTILPRALTAGWHYLMRSIWVIESCSSWKATSPIKPAAFRMTGTCRWFFLSQRGVIGNCAISTSSTFAGFPRNGQATAMAAASCMSIPFITMLHGWTFSMQR
jgi:hypothetical protein